MNIIEEIDEAISELTGLKNKYPKMETQAVIDLIGRLKDKVKKNVVLDNVSRCSVCGIPKLYGIQCINPETGKCDFK